MASIRMAMWLMMVLAMTIAALGGSLASAQSSSDDDGTYVSELTDLELTFSDDWELGETQIFEGPPEEEMFQLVSDEATLTMGFGVAADAEESRDLVLEGYETNVDEITILDEGYERGLAWILAEAEQTNGLSVYVYIEVDEDLVDDFQFMSMLVAERDVFVDQYELVNETVELDGDAVFDQFDTGDIEDAIEGGGASDEGDEDDLDESTPAADEDGNQRETGRDLEDSEEEEEEETDNGTGDDSYQFESADLEVTVSGDVEISDAEYEQDSYEQVILVGTGSIGVVSIMEGPLEIDEIAEELMTEFDNPEEIDSGEEGSVAWTVYQASIDDVDWYFYVTVDGETYEDQSFLQVFAAPVDDIEDEFVLFQESVQIDGEPIFPDVDVDDILQIIEG